MRPEEIQNHDFLVGLRGYDKDEVRAFLTEVAAEQERLLVALEQSQAQAAQAPAAPAAQGADEDFESLGAGVAAILRTAKEQAGQITGDAQARAAAMQEEAESIRREAKESAASLREQVSAETEALRERVTGEADQLRQQAEQHVADARAEADRIVREATDRVRQIEIEHDARMNNKAEEIARREEAARQRLLEAADEVQLALVALNDAPATEAGSNHREEETPALG